jgi:nucleoside-diphosphate-sugar epimerase
MTRKVVLVTGAGGFIGRWSVPPLIAAGYEVHAVLGRAAGRAVPETLRDAVLHRAELLEPQSVEALLDAVRPSHLLHFAWTAVPGRYWTSPDNYRWLAAGRQLLDTFAARGGARVVMAGSCAEYDWSRAGVCDERGTPLADEAGAAGAAGGAGVAGAAITPYAACKIELARALARFDPGRRISSAWGRVFFLFGPGEHRDRLVASAILSLLAGREALCTHGRQIRSFLHVADVGRAFAALLDSAAEGPVNIGSPERLSIAALLDRIAGRIGGPELVRLGARPAPAAEPPLLIPDLGRLYGEVGWRPQFSLDAGLEDTIAWWRANATRGGPATAPP